MDRSTESIGVRTSAQIEKYVGDTLTEVYESLPKDKSDNTLFDANKADNEGIPKK